MEELLLRILPLRTFPVPTRYAATTFIVLMTLLVHVGLDAALTDSPFLLFVFAVFLSAMLFDRGSGFWATGVSVVLVRCFLMEPRYRLTPETNQITVILLFVLICVAITILTETLRLAVERLSTAQGQKQLLFDELAHRTRNDLTLITSFLTLQAKAQEDAATRAQLETAVERVRVIGRAHQRLQPTESGTYVNMRDYLEDLTQGLGEALGGVKAIAVQVEAEPIELAASTAVSIGLLVNELVTNAVKYAFPNDFGGRVAVSLRAEEGELALVVADDGIGCPEHAVDGLGSRLMRLIVTQLGGRFTRHDAKPGCRVTIRFPAAGDAPSAFRSP